jgi:uncharacterized membrane protein SirB2
MTSSTFLQLCLVGHVAGFTIMAGTVFADFSILRRLNKYLVSDKRKALSILEGSAGLPALIGIGAALLVASGIGMVFLFKGAVTGAPWFRIKMLLVLAVILNGTVMARPAVQKLRKLLLQDAAGNDHQVDAQKKRIRTIYVLQILFFLIIFILSIFKFS